MQLTKSDVEWEWDDMIPERQVIDYDKFQQVVEFYEKYKDKDWCEELEPLWRHRDLTIRNWNDWLFSYCFKDGLK
jgi:hypothetical protein